MTNALLEACSSKMDVGPVMFIDNVIGNVSVYIQAGWRCHCMLAANLDARLSVGILHIFYTVQLPTFSFPGNLFHRLRNLQIIALQSMTCSPNVLTRGFSISSLVGHHSLYSLMCGLTRPSHKTQHEGRREARTSPGLILTSLILVDFEWCGAWQR